MGSFFATHSCFSCFSGPKVVIQLISRKTNKTTLYLCITLQQDQLFDDGSIVKDTAYDNLETTFLKVYSVTLVHRCMRELCHRLT